MLADAADLGHAGYLENGTHLPSEWLSSLVGFIGSVLPSWRDDPARMAQTSETSLTAQLCAKLNSVSRHTPGWDFLQFKREEPDEVYAGRSIDLAVAPSGAVIWIAGREYSEYRTLLPIECKRLPTPNRADRDEREYLISRFNTTGGVQRFKSGHHGAAHLRAAMIGYIQDRGIPHWQSQLDMWIDGIIGEAITGWTVADKLVATSHDPASRFASLRSSHGRNSDLAPILIDHLWVEM